MADKLETLAGGREVAVQFIDGSSGSVMVRQLPIRSIRKFADAMAQADEAGQIEMFTGRDSAWVDRLTNGAAVAVLVIGQELNEDFLSSWAMRQKTLAERLTSKMPSLT